MNLQSNKALAILEAGRRAAVPMLTRHWRGLCIAAIVGVFVLSLFLPLVPYVPAYGTPSGRSAWELCLDAVRLLSDYLHHLPNGDMVACVFLGSLSLLFPLGALLLVLRRNTSAMALGILGLLGGSFFWLLVKDGGGILLIGYFVWLASMVLLALAGGCFAFLAKREPGLKTSARDSLRGGGMQGLHMQVRILQSGDDVSVVIPRALADAARLEPGAIAEASVEEGKLAVEPASRPKYTSEQLLTGITERNRHDEIPSGPPVGEEAR